jgi:hypothetical protein
VEMRGLGGRANLRPRPGPPGVRDKGDTRRARVGVSIGFTVCGAGFATWAARVLS